MKPALKIALESAKTLLPGAERALVQAAYARRPTPLLRGRLAILLLWDDAYPDIIALLRDVPDRSDEEEFLLIQAWLAQETPAGDAAAWAVADAVLRRADDPAVQAGALAYRGKAELRMHRPDAARASFQAALTLNPHNKDACKRLVALDLETGDPQRLVATTNALLDRGAAHARLFAGAVLARARAGDLAGAHAIDGDFRHAQRLEPPPGWSTIEAFNAAVAQELLAHPEIRFDRYGAASERTWRIDSPLTHGAPLTRLLLDSISAAIRAHVDRIADSDHPWARAIPRHAVLRSWCVITDQAGFEHWHVHQSGWLSGAYYVQLPDGIESGVGEGGCIAFGLPETLVGDDAAAAFGIDLVRPRNGLLLLFPAHAYHRTYPHGFDGRRICVAFDLRAGAEA